MLKKGNDAGTFSIFYAPHINQQFLGLKLPRMYPYIEKYFE